MKVLFLDTFEGIAQPGPAGGSRPMFVQSVLGSDKVTAYQLPGGAFLVDWGDSIPGNKLGTMGYVSAANVKTALVQLNDEEKAKLLK